MTDRPMADLELEREILGLVLAYEQTVACLVAGLEARDFYRDAHRWIWQAACDLEGQATAANLVTVGAELRRRGQLEEVGPAYFARLTDGAARPTPEHIAFIASRLQALTAARECVAIGHQMQVALERQPADVAGQVQHAIAKLEGTQSRVDKRRQPLGSYEQVAAMLADLQRDPGESVRLGFPTLDDDWIPGVYPGEVFGLMARPGIGKTLLLGHIARANAGRGHVFFSLEMPTAQIVARITRAVYGWDRRQLEGAARAESFNSVPYVHATKGLRILDAPGLSVAQIDGILRELAGQMKDTPIRLVTIDHLGLIGGDRALSTYDRVSTQARELKELAKRHHVTVLVAIQVNREQGGDGSRELTLGSARDSGVVEEAVDYLIGLRRLDRSRDSSQDVRQKFRDVIWAMVLKNRHGGHVGDELALRGNFYDMTMQEDPLLHPEEADLKDLLKRARR